MGVGKNPEGSVMDGMEVMVWSEKLVQDEEEEEEGKGKSWIGGVPAIVRDYSSSSSVSVSAPPTEEKGEGEEGMVSGDDGDDHWVGGLNGLLKFNYPFGEEEEGEGEEQKN